MCGFRSAASAPAASPSRGPGRLCDWSVRNRPALQSFDGYSHFAVKAEQDGKLLDALLMVGPCRSEDPAGGRGAMRPMFRRLRARPLRHTMVGLPHFKQVDFYGRFRPPT